jgi:dienelactone hydrolase
MKACVAALAVLLGLSTAARAESLRVPVDYQGQQIEIPARFEKPDGAGPFPAVVLLHGCSGNDAYAQRRSERWAEILHQQGYATLITDSFGPRGYTNVCNNAALMPMRERAKDIFAAAYLLAQRSDVRPDRIAAMGFSHGGGTVLDAAVSWDELKPWREKLASRGKLVALVGLYPGCVETKAMDFRLPVLILVGDADDWTPARDCQSRTGKSEAGVPALRMKVYPGAVHDFDVNEKPRKVVGHALGYDEAAAKDAPVQVVDFLRHYLN